MPRVGRLDDGSERDSLVLLVGQLGSEGRALADALQATGYAIQWETSPEALTAAASVQAPPAAVLVECGRGRDPFGVVRWLRAQRSYAHALVFAFCPKGRTLPVGEGIAAGADDVIHAPVAIDDILDRVAARVARARTIEERVFFDCVTQVRNRLFISERLPGELARALGRHGHASCAVLDVEGVDTIRRDNGRIAADRSLELFAFGLRSSLRGVDVACRFDDRTFVVLMPGLDATAAAISLGAAERPPRKPNGLAPRLRVVRAFSEAPKDGATWEELFNAAERRLRSPRAPSSTIASLSPS